MVLCLIVEVSSHWVTVLANDIMNSIENTSLLSHSASHNYIIICFNNKILSFSITVPSNKVMNRIKDIYSPSRI